MSENTCKDCEDFVGNRTICKAKGQRSFVSSSSPICWLFKLRKENVDQSEWQKRTLARKEEYEDERMQSQWSHS